MKLQSYEDMIEAGASLQEAEEATRLIEDILPGVIIKKNGRIQTVGGDFTPLGFYRRVKFLLDGGKR